MRIVFLTRYYPPEIAGGARRPSTLVRALRTLGADVTLVAPLGAEDAHCIGVPHPSFPAVPDIAASRSGTKMSIGDRLRSTFLLPDPEVRWALRAADAALEAAKKADWIITSSPPESLHLAGKILKHRSNCLWLADLRDLWLSSPQLAVRRNPIRHGIETHLAQWILSDCDAISSVSAVLETEAQTIAGHAKPSLILPHFAAPFVGTPEQLPDATFNIVHTGSIGLSNPLSQFSALLTDFERLAIVRPRIALWLAGHLSRDELQAIKQSPIKDKIHCLGPVPIERARALQMGADALAIVSGSQSHALPGKIAEYILTGLPILISARGPWSALLPVEAKAVNFDEAVDLPKADLSYNRPCNMGSGLEAAQGLLDFMSNVQAEKGARKGRT